MKSTNTLYLILFLVWAVYVSAQPAIIPSPQKSETTNRGALYPSDIKYIIAEECDMPVLYGRLDRLPRTKVKGVGVVLKIDTALVLPSEEGYVLDVSKKGINITSKSKAGLFYGAITLNRLMEETEELGKSITAVHIEDYPALPTRAVHFDTKHHLDRTEYYYSLIDRLAQWKVNTIIWEVEDKLRYERRPECAAQNALSKQEMRAISDYAIERNIAINPLVQGLGHAGFILKHHWELRENPDSDWEFCPSNPEIYNLQFDLYRDALEAMPHGKYLHIGGDEITAIGIDERCKATGKTAFELQMEWLGKVCAFAKENGRQPIFWDDMPLKYGDVWGLIRSGLSNEEVDKKWHTDKLDEAIDMFPKDCVYMRWHYTDPTVYPHLKVLEWYKNKGLKVMAATAAADGGSPYMPRFGSKIDDIKAFCRLAVDNNLDEGILATCWDDGSPHWETVLRGFAALGEFSWNPYAKRTDEFKTAFERSYFGLYNGETSFIEDLERAAYFFDGALVCKGRRNPAWQVRDYTLIDLPSVDSIGAWSLRNRDLLDRAKVQIALCDSIENAINIAEERCLRHRYPLEIYRRNNELFRYPASILLALEKYDNASDKAESKDDLRNVCESLLDIKSRLVTSYGKTRFMSQPTGYVADNNHHKHLAALKPTADWMFIYEDDFTQCVKKLIE